MHTRTIGRTAAAAVAAATALATLAAVEVGEPLGASGLAVHGQHVYAATSDSLDRWDVSDPAAPVRTWTLPYGLTTYGDERLDVGGDLLVALVPLGSHDRERMLSPMRHLSACDAECELHVYDVSGELPELLSRIPMDTHNATCVDDCRLVLTTAGHAIDLTDPRAPRTAAGPWWGRDTDLWIPHDLGDAGDGRVLHVRGNAASLVDLRGEHPEVVRSWESDTDTTTANHVAVATGSSIAFVSEFTLQPWSDATCGVRWFDLEQQGSVHRWAPEPGPTVGGHVNSSCMSDAEPHPDFADNGLVAVALGSRGLVLLRIDGGLAEVVEQVDMVDGRALSTAGDVAWLDGGRVAVSLYEGRVAVHDFGLG